MDTARRSVRVNRRRRSGAPLLGQLLTAAVESAADTAAIRFNPTGDPADQREVTYRELDEASSRLARELIDRGAGPGDLVAIAITRSVESVLAVWAVAKTGAAYVPVDPAYPADRIAHILSDSQVLFGLTTQAHRAGLGRSVYWIELDDPVVAERFAARPAHPISYTDRVRPLIDKHPAYVIYTSGSTGLPKGVVVTHTGLSGLVIAQCERYAVTGESRVTQLSSPSFDFSLMEMLFTFFSGATLVIVPPKVFGGADLAELVRRERITHLLITPGALETVEPTGLDELRVVVVGGDRVHPELVGRWATGDREMFNAYGPTEATVMVTTSAPMRPRSEVTIGEAIPGVAAFVLDSRLLPVPAGVIGELYLSGAALAQGYLGRPALTADRFVASPFGADTGREGARLYRTGDLVRRHESDGVLEYLGRCDFQVKIGGLRVELGEIDSVLTSYPGIDFAATVGTALPSGATALVAYVLPHPGVIVDTAEVADFAGKSLPDYMIPSVVVVLDEIPLTPAGKLDRAALPEPEFATEQFRTPATRTEQIVADVFAALLVAGATDTGGRVGVDDDFFALGGNSVLAAQAVARIGNALDARVPVHMLFEVSSVAGLAERVQRLADDGGPALGSLPRPDRIPLSFAQRRMWFLNRFDRASATDHIPVVVRLSGLLDVDALRAAVRDVVERHESLRTIYPDIDGEGCQVVLPVEDARAVPELEQQQVAEIDLTRFVTAAILDGFDVTTEPPVRVRLLQTSEAEHVLVCVVHHIAGDGFSLAPLTRDLMAAYVTRTRGGRPDWQPPAVQYPDYTIWQRAILGSEDDANSLSARQIAYWQHELAGLPGQLELPVDRPRPVVATNNGAVLAFDLDAEVHQLLRDVAQQHNSTLFMVVHAALAVLLARLSGTRDIAIGTPVAGRSAEALDDLIGMFVNTLVLRADVDPGSTFEQLLRAVRQTDVQAFGHADVPFERLVELLDPVRSTARHPLFQVMLTFQNLARPELELPGLSVSGVEMALPRAKFDLQLEVAENIDADGAAHGISALFTYATDLFDAATVHDFADRFGKILAAVAADSAVVVGDIDVYAPGERELVLHAWNTPGVRVPEVTLVDLIAAQVRQRPDAVAVRCGDAALTFGELQRRANQVARALIARGAGPETLVAVAVSRTEELPVALLGVLTTGAAYLPIDTAYPVQRLEYILADAAPVCVLSTASERDAVPPGDIPFVLLEQTSEFADGRIIDAHRIAPLRPDNLAYVIYTSGSTGEPKGVGVAHRNVLELFANTQLLLEFDETDVWTLFHSFAFDFSVWELWCALANGGSVVMVDHFTARAPEQFRELLIRERVTVLNQTPSAFYQLAEADRAAHSAGAGTLALRYVIFGGEALDLRQLQPWYERHAMNEPWLVNMYGITETTVHVSFLSLDERHIHNAASVIGRALPGLDAFVLDNRLHPAPVGVAGEIYVAGGQLSRGYLGRPGLAATRFVANPFGAPGSRMYRSGDIGRWVGFGGEASLEYAGRSDQQVQLRGFRIELGEIESALLRCPGVSRAAVVVHSDEYAGDRLIGYVVPAAPEGGRLSRLDPTELRSQVAEFLTGYMVPDAFEIIEALPLTPNGKLDRRALPAPAFLSATSFRAPGSPIEQAVAEVFAGLLGVAEVGLDDDFFLLGGNSLLATKAVARINEALHANIVVRELFEASTVGTLAARIVPGAAAAAEARSPLVRMTRPDRIPLSLAQQRMWVLNRVDPNSLAYNIPMAIRLTGALDVAALRYAIADVLERHESLRTRYPTDGPGGTAFQEILPVDEVLPGGLAVEVTTDPVARLTEMMSTGFDVTAQVPVRVLLLNVTAAVRRAGSAEVHLLVLVVHHITADGTSMAPLSRDLMTAYLAHIHGNSPGWQPLEVQYADFAIWQREVIGADDDENSVAARQLAYWREQLDGFSGALELPVDRPRPATPSMRGASTAIRVPAAVHEGLVRIAREQHSTLFMVVHAALAVLLARLSGSSDIAVGTPFAGRAERALDDLVGMFVNSLTLRTAVPSGIGFAALVDQVRETDLSAFANADIPFERVVEETVLARAAGHHPLFQVALSFEDTEPPSLELPGLTVTGLDAGTVTAKFDLQLIVEPRHRGDGSPEEMVAVFAYATDIFDHATVQAFGRRFERILSAVVADPQVCVGDIDILDAQERSRAQAVPTAAAAGTENSASTARIAPTQLLAVAVESDPFGPAVVSGEAVLSYQDLDAGSSRLARVLIGHGCGPGTGVAVRLDRSADVATTIWAVLKAGAALVPLRAVDSALPGELALKVGISSASGITRRGSVPTSGIDWLILDDPAVIAEIDLQSSKPVTYANRTRTLRGDDPAIMLPDTGATLTYDELATAAERLVARAGLTFESRTFRHGRPETMAALLEVIATGAVGASVVTPGREQLHLPEVLADEWVTHLFTDAAGLAAVEVGEPADLQVVVLDDGAARPMLIAGDSVEVLALPDLLRQ
ncbi:amino acid adenylation domain-containing protein [Nocardia sp. NPDC057440]|uniref:amino acid adenylation domain-containing protein n=1 Tax=Nocardia sp. NPDC057440 TaxID=3346134 RepID=UPI00366FFD53